MNKKDKKKTLPGFCSDDDCNADVYAESSGTIVRIPGVFRRREDSREIPGKPPNHLRLRGAAFLNHSKSRKFYGKVYSEWQRFLQKRKPGKNVSISVDTSNGYMRYQIVGPEDNDTTVMEMCFWNCADGKRKLVCANTYMVLNGDYGWDEYIGTYFYVYDNLTRIMRTVLPEDIGALFDSDGLSVFFLPRRGKNIRVSAAGGGERWNEELEWDGYMFNLKQVP